MAPFACVSGVGNSVGIRGQGQARQRREGHARDERHEAEGQQGAHFVQSRRDRGRRAAEERHRQIVRDRHARVGGPRVQKVLDLEGREARAAQRVDAGEAELDEDDARAAGAARRACGARSARDGDAAHPDRRRRLWLFSRRPRRFEKGKHLLLQAARPFL